MKKKFVFLLFLVLFIKATFAQDLFTVIKVSGNIVIERTGSSLDIGTSFAQNENLVFKIPESRAAVINPQRGRFLLTSENNAEFKNTKSTFLPAAGKISTRGMETKPETTDLKDLFQGDFVILNEMKVKIDTLTYHLSDKEFFYISYDYQGRTINKKLAFTHDTLLIKKNELLIVNGTEINAPKISEMVLNYFKEGESYVSTPVSSFTPVLPDFFSLTQEIRLMIDMMANMTYDEKVYEISVFIREFYGKIDENNLKMWLNRYLDLK